MHPLVVLILILLPSLKPLGRKFCYANTHQL